MQSSKRSEGDWQGLVSEVSEEGETVNSCCGRRPVLQTLPGSIWYELRSLGFKTPGRCLTETFLTPVGSSLMATASCSVKLITYDCVGGNAPARLHMMMMIMMMMLCKDPPVGPHIPVNSTFE